MSPLGWLHLASALVALITGAAVLLTRKGTRRHRIFGYLFFTSMLVLNVAALSIYRINGRWTGFHSLSLASLITLAVGMTAGWLRRPAKQWLLLHGGFMAGAYVGLVAAGVAQIATRTAPAPGTVLIATGVITAAGVYLIVKYLPSAARNAAR